MNSAKELLQYLFNAIKIWVIIQPWEQAVRTRGGKNQKLLNSGIYFKIPYFDSIFVQETRLRICDMPMFTATTKDDKSITIGLTIGYSLEDISKMYNTLFHPETTIRNIATSEMCSIIYNSNMLDIKPIELESKILEYLKTLDYGMKFQSVKINNFAIVRTYRLIQDRNWTGETVKMNEKR